MRLFVAVFPPESVVHAWMAFQMAAPHWRVRWTPPSELHVTLDFLGSTDNQLEPAVNKTLEQLAAQTRPFRLQFKSGGVFPPKGAPSVFWAGVEGETAALTELAHHTEQSMKGLGFLVEDRAYHPHMTVARLEDKHVKLSGQDGRDFTAWVQKFSSEEFLVDRLCLVESKTGPTGAVYTVRRSFPFNAG